MPSIETARTHIERVACRHAPALSAYYQDNAAHLAPWEPRRDAGYHDVAQWEERLAAWERDGERGHSAHWLAFAKDSRHAVIGVCSLTNISRGVFQACNLGYSISADYEGRGLMTEIVAAVVDYAFETLALHRVMANFMPENHRSGAVLERLGFEREGLARSYLKIDGQWRDHVLTAKVNDKL